MEGRARFLFAVCVLNRVVFSLTVERFTKGDQHCCAITLPGTAVHTGKDLGLGRGKTAYQFTHIFGVRVIIELLAQFFAGGKDIFRGQGRMITAALTEQISAKQNRLE